MNHVAHNAFPVGRWTIRTNDLNDSRKVKKSPEGTVEHKGQVGCHQLCESTQRGCHTTEGKKPGEVEPSAHAFEPRGGVETQTLGGCTGEDDAAEVATAGVAPGPLGSLLSLNPKLVS